MKRKYSTLEKVKEISNDTGKCKTCLNCDIYICHESEQLIKLISVLHGAITIDDFGHKIPCPLWKTDYLVCPIHGLALRNRDDDPTQSNCYYCEEERAEKILSETFHSEIKSTK